MSQTTQVRQITVKFDTQGNQALKEFSDKLGGMSKNVKSLSTSVNFLSSTFAGYFAALRIGDIVSMSDSMQLLTSRIAILSGGTSQAEEIMNGLLDTANRTKTSIDGLATIYSRLAAATKETGISSGTLLKLTEVLQNTFRLSGATITESTAAAIQLSQGFASGQLRGQELRSVLEANVEIGGILSKTFGVTRGELYKLAEAGKLTAGKVMLALLNSVGDVNGRAQQLGQTFEQTTTVAFNNLKVAVANLNKELDASGTFARGMTALTERFTLLATVSIPLVVAGIYSIRTSLIALFTTAQAAALANPVTAAFTVMGAAILLTFNNLKQFTGYAKFAFESIKQGLIEVEIFFNKIDKKFARDKDKIRFDSIINGLKEMKKASIAAQDSIFAPSGDDIAKQEAAAKARKQEEEDRKKLLALAGEQKVKEEKLKEILGKINMEYKSGTITVSQYYEKLNAFEKLKLDRAFRDGKIELDKFIGGLEEIERKDLLRKLNAGSISMEEFNAAIEASKLTELNAKFSQGTVTLAEYDEQLNKLSSKFNEGSAFRSGVRSYIESIGTVGSNVADAIKSAFSNLEEAFLQFTKSGKADFSKFTKAILDDLLRIIIRASIIRPIANGILGALDPNAGAAAGGTSLNYTGTGDVMLAAKGAAFDNGVRRFAKGGLISQPTMFGYGNGKTGLMGEAGTEAILPLARGSNGNLGVQAAVTPVTINITNNSNSEISQSESIGQNGERTIDILVKAKVREQIASGAYDKVMQTSYGLNRRGS